MTDQKSQQQSNSKVSNGGDSSPGEQLSLSVAHEDLAKNYWVQSRGPLASLLFILPLLAVYEFGVLRLGPNAVRNGVDVWLRQLLDLFGFGQYFLLPLLTIGILLVWQYTSRQPWRVSRGVLCGMAVESLLLAVCLRMILHMQDVFSQTFSSQHAAGAVWANISSTFSNLVMFLGAGIYEELLFRLIFLSVAIWALRQFGMKPKPSVVAAVVLTSLLFSAAHYIGAQGESLQVFSFTFRFIAGVFFCMLFVYRGFGIAAGTHAAYDIVVGIF
ncbi:MAG: CPBP family intramembrane glutamic endopeptidase [Planctomycetota bacterium]|nr:CPBP family intramembrane glutamic endopeptidase [Planctomycetota bacterium]